MEETIQTPRLVRFGTFEADLQSGELRKSGLKLKCAGQPFQVLAMLLEHPGDVVTRDELQQRLWPDTFVDIDNNLNSAINKIREALGDSAENPQFIETLPRRGYRFIAPIRSLEREAGPVTPGKGALERPRSAISIALGVALLAAAGITTLSRLHLQRSSRLTEQDTILLADFSNTTGDPVFDATLKQSLRAQLEQSPFLNILSDEKVSEELKMMGRPKDEKLTIPLAREVCQRLGSKAILAGSISKIGTHFALGLNALSCHTADGLGSLQAEADNREKVLGELGALATTLRKRLGESLSTIQKYDAPPEDVTTSSLEALEAYSEGTRVWVSKGTTPALPFFQRAVVLDPQFAMAYARLGALYSFTGNVALSAKNIRRAYDLRRKASERERLYIEAHYYRDVTGEADKAAELWEVRKQIYPREVESYTNLTGYYAQRGNYEKALDEARVALQLDPQDQDNYSGVVFCDIWLNRLNEAQQIVQKAEQAKVDSGLLLFARYEIAFLRGQTGEMERLLAASSNNEAADEFRFWRSAVEAFHGRLKKARELLPPPEPANVPVWAQLGVSEAYFGLASLAHRDADAVLRIDPTRVGHFPWLPLALALATAGDVSAAEKFAFRVDKDQPLRTQVQRDWLPTVRAAIALDQRNAAKVIELLRAMTPYELGVLGLLPIYERGQAYLILRNGEAAALEFQKIIDHPGIVEIDPIGPLAHLGLARALVLRGETHGAQIAYNKFFDVWKDADPDIPILIAAKAEYAKLK